MENTQTGGQYFKLNVSNWLQFFFVRKFTNFLRGCLHEDQDGIKRGRDNKRDPKT